MGKKFYNKKVEDKLIDDFKKTKKLGRPTLYNEEVAKRICELIEITPKSFIDILIENPDLPDYTTINTWLKEKPIFREKYERAKLKQVELHIEFTNKIADDVMSVLAVCDQLKSSAYVSAAKLRIESRQWQASRLMPKKFSDKAREEEAEEIRKKLTEEQIVEKLASVLSGAEKRIAKK